MIEIRPFAPSDRLSVLRALIEMQNYEMALHDTRLPGEAVSEAYLDRMLRDVEAGGGMLFIAELDGVFLGFVGCLVIEYDVVQETPDSNRYGYIKDIFVDSRHRGRGIAQQLLAAAEQHLAGTGVTRLRLNVLANNLRARRAYERYGFADYEAIYEKRISANPPHDMCDVGAPTGRVRRATIADADQVFALTQSFATSFQPEAEAFANSFGRLLAQDDALLLVADDSGQLLGYLLGLDHYSLFANGRVSWIEEIMVREDSRRRGCGKDLVTQFEQWANSRGSKLVALATRRAPAFYLALGYEVSASCFRKLL